MSRIIIKVEIIRKELAHSAGYYFIWKLTSFGLLLIFYLNSIFDTAPIQVDSFLIGIFW